MRTPPIHCGLHLHKNTLRTQGEEVAPCCQSGVLQACQLADFAGIDTFEYLRPLFEVWQQKGLIELNGQSLVLTLAGSFWAVTLAQACIQVLSSEYQQQQQTYDIAL